MKPTSPSLLSTLLLFSPALLYIAQHTTPLPSSPWLPAPSLNSSTTPAHSSPYWTFLTQLAAVAGSPSTRASVALFRALAHYFYACLVAVVFARLRWGVRRVPSFTLLFCVFALPLLGPLLLGASSSPGSAASSAPSLPAYSRPDNSFLHSDGRWAPSSASSSAASTGRSVLARLAGLHAQHDRLSSFVTWSLLVGTLLVFLVDEARRSHERVVAAQQQSRRSSSTTPLAELEYKQERVMDRGWAPSLEAHATVLCAGFIAQKTMPLWAALAFGLWLSWVVHEAVEFEWSQSVWVRAWRSSVMKMKGKVESEDEQAEEDEEEVREWQAPVQVDEVHSPTLSGLAPTPVIGSPDAKHHDLARSPFRRKPRRRTPSKRQRTKPRSSRKRPKRPLQHYARGSFDGLAAAFYRVPPHGYQVLCAVREALLAVSVGGKELRAQQAAVLRRVVGFLVSINLLVLGWAVVAARLRLIPSEFIADGHPGSALSEASLARIKYCFAAGLVALAVGKRLWSVTFEVSVALTIAIIASQ